VTNVWICTAGDVLVRADSIVLIEGGVNGLHAECITGRTVLLSGSRCSTASQIALLEEIRHAGAEDRRTVVILETTDRKGGMTWHREAADTLIDRLNDRPTAIG
jgi:hypothetical protein